MIKKTFEWGLKLYSIILLFYLLLNGLNSSCWLLSSVFILTSNYFQLLKSKDNFFLFLILLFITYCNYSVIYANYINPLTDSYYIKTLAREYVDGSVNVLAIFTAVTLWFVKWDKVFTDNDFDFGLKVGNPRLILTILTFILIYILIFCFERPSAPGGRGTPSSLYEYALCFFVVYFYLCKNYRFYRYVGVGLILLFSLQNFVYGGRILGIQYLLVVYLILYKNKISRKLFYILLSSMFVLMSLIGVVRGNILAGNFDLSNILTDLYKSGFALDTSYSAFFTSETYLYVSELIPFDERLSHFYFFIRSIFVGFGDHYDEFPSYITDSYVANGGGSYIPHFFYFYLGIIGVIIGGFLVSVYFNILRKPSFYKSPYLKCIIIFVTSTVFRWYLYSPLELLRGVLLLSLLLFICMFFVEKNKNIRYENSN